MSSSLDADLPRLRIVTVCRNDLDGLRRTMQSVDSQTSAPFEHVILDGASTDGTVEHLRDDTGPGWRSYRSEPDAGIYDAMNKGLRGDWDLLLFLNSGDVLHDASVVDTIRSSWRQERWSWAYGRAAMSDGSGSTLRLHDLHFLARTRFITGIRSIPHQATVLSRDLVHAVGEHRLDVGLSADQEFLYRCWSLTPPHRIDEVLAVCEYTGVSSRQRPGAFARQMAKHRADHGRWLLGSPLADRVVTDTAVAWDGSKRRASAVLHGMRR